MLNFEVRSIRVHLVIPIRKLSLYPSTGPLLRGDDDNVC